MRVVLDTNILVSGTFWTGNSFKILKRIDNKEIELILSQELIEEYNKVIYSDEIIEKVKNKDLTINSIIQKIVSDATIVEPKKNFDIVEEDPDDNKILECAFEGNVNYIITKDSHLLKIKEFQGIEIITPEEFLNHHFPR